MATVAPATPTLRTFADLMKTLGDIPADRIRLHPAPGTATEQDLLDVLDHEGRICELIDGVLVEKAMGYPESRVAGFLLTFFNIYLMQHNRGAAAGPDGTLKLTTGLLRVPDVSFVSWDRLPGRTLPPEPVPHLPLDLAVEVISKGNTEKEMQRKLREYFAAGTPLVWFLYPKTRQALIYTSPTDFRRLTEDEALDGGDVLPGFTLSLRELFDRATRGPDA